MSSGDRLRPYSRGDVWAQSASEARAFDARAIEAVEVPQPVLMENAGRSVAQVIHRVYGERPEGRSRPRVVGLVGAGNNGGDALVVLRTLAAWGWDATAVLAADRPADDPLLHGWPVTVIPDGAADAADASAGIPRPGLVERLARADVVVDGVLGTGARGAPRARQARLIEAANAAGCPVIALDVPSGIDATSGAVPGAAIQAALTVSFGAPKTGALVHPGRAHVGRHVTVEIGFPPLSGEDATAVVVTPEWARLRFPVRGSDTHKNRVGRVLVVGGQVGMAGAIVLTARAAFRAGAGLVRVCSVPENREVVQSAIPEAMWVSMSDVAGVKAAVSASDAIAVGPGMGTSDEAADLLRRVVGQVTAAMRPVDADASVRPVDADAPRILLDADALNLVAAGSIDLAEVARAGPVLITPHPGEMARLAVGVTHQDQAAESEVPSRAGPIATARAAARRSGATVLLKGAPSIVATPAGAVFIDTQSSSDLAVAGMGDALSGVCAALMAQGLEAAHAGSVGLYLSGRAAALASKGSGLTPSDVIERLPDVLAERRVPASDLDLPFVTFDADAAR